MESTGNLPIKYYEEVRSRIHGSRDCSEGTVSITLGVPVQLTV